MKNLLPILFFCLIFQSSYAFDHNWSIHRDTLGYGQTNKQNAFGIGVSMLFPSNHLFKPGSGTFFHDLANPGVAANLTFEGTLSKVWAIQTIVEYNHQPFINKWSAFSDSDAIRSYGIYAGLGLWLGSNNFMVQLHGSLGLNIQENFSVQTSPDSISTISFFEPPKLGYRFDGSIRYRVSKWFAVKGGVGYQFYKPDARIDHRYSPLNLANTYGYITLMSLIKINSSD